MKTKNIPVTPGISWIWIDGKKHTFDDLQSVIISKIPFYGFGMKVAPALHIDDGNLHVYALSRNIFRSMLFLTSSYIYDISTEPHLSGKQVKISVNKDVPLQLNGDMQMKNTQIELRKNYAFDVLPSRVKIIY